MISRLCGIIFFVDKLHCGGRFSSCDGFFEAASWSRFGKSWVRKHVGFTSVALVSPDLLFYLLFTSFAGVSCLNVLLYSDKSLFDGVEA